MVGGGGERPVGVPRPMRVAEREQYAWATGKYCIFRVYACGNTSTIEENTSDRPTPQQREQTAEFAGGRRHLPGI